MLFLFFVACAAKVEPEQIDAVLALDGDPDQGATVYKDNCVDCHEKDGKGMHDASLPEKVPANTDEDIVENILAGPWIMPNFVDSLSNQEVADVFAHLRSEWGEFDPSLAEE